MFYVGTLIQVFKLKKNCGTKYFSNILGMLLCFTILDQFLFFVHSQLKVIFMCNKLLFNLLLTNCQITCLNSYN